MAVGMQFLEPEAGGHQFVGTGFHNGTVGLVKKIFYVLGELALCLLFLHLAEAECLHGFALRQVDAMDHRL